MRVEYFAKIEKPENFHGEDYWYELRMRICDFLDKKGIEYSMPLDHEYYLNDYFYLFLDEKDDFVLNEIKDCFGVVFNDNEGKLTKVLKKSKSLFSLI